MHQKSFSPLQITLLTFSFLLYLSSSPVPTLSVFSSHWSMFGRLPLTRETAVGSLLIIQPQRGRVTEGDALIVIGQLWTPAPPTCKRGQRSNKSSQAQHVGWKRRRRRRWDRQEGERKRKRGEGVRGGHARMAITE